MASQLWWYSARAGGIVAWALLTASVVWGLVMSAKLRPPRVRPAWTLDLHRYLGGLATIFVGVHVGSIILDSYTHFGLSDVLVPFASQWHPLAVAWGVVAMYVLLAVEITSLARRSLPQRVWRRVHMLAFPLWLIATVHFVTAGTDATTTLALVAMIGARRACALFRLSGSRSASGILARVRVKTDVVVIGAGAMGSSTAWWLARRGRSRGAARAVRAGHARGSSHGGGRASSATPTPIRSTSRSRQRPAAVDASWRTTPASPCSTRSARVDHGDPAIVDRPRGRHARGRRAVRAAVAGGGRRALARPALRGRGRAPARRGAAAAPTRRSPRCRPGCRSRRRRAVLRGPGRRSRWWRRRGASRPAATSRSRRRDRGDHRGRLGGTGRPARWVGLPAVTVTEEQIVHFPPRSTDAAEWPSFIHHGTERLVYGLRDAGRGHQGRRAPRRAGRRSRRAQDVRSRSGAGRAGRCATPSAGCPASSPIPVFGVTCLYTTTPTEDFVVDRRGPFVIGSPAQATASSSRR